MIVAFAHTTPSLLAGRKTRTRRKWKDVHAARVQKVIDRQGTLDAWDFSPRVKPMRLRQGLSAPRKVGVIRPLRLVREDIAQMPDGDYEPEGFAYLAEQGLTIWGQDPQDAFDGWRAWGGVYWVLDFAFRTEAVSPLSGQEPRATASVLPPAFSI